MKGAIASQRRFYSDTPNKYFMPQQFENPANPEIHRRTTAEEIWRDTEGTVDIVHLERRHRRHHYRRRRSAQRAQNGRQDHTVEPDASLVLSGGKPGPHKTPGLRPGFVPEVLDTKVYSEVITCPFDNAIATARRLAREEGLLLGISSGANVWAALQVAARPQSAGKTIVTIGCDTGERYLSNPVFADQEAVIVEPALLPG